MTNLERLAPHLTALAAEVLPGLRIHYRAKSYWLGDVQLTYTHEVRDGRHVHLGGSASAENAALAERILRKCLAAREQPEWGTRWERQRRILVGLREEVVPTFRLHHWCHWRHPSLDDGWLFRSVTAARYTAGLRLVGDDGDVDAEGPTMEGAIEALWAKFAPVGERPTWWGDAP